MCGRRSTAWPRKQPAEEFTMDQAGSRPESVFDLQGTLQRLGGDRELLGQLITLCLSDAPRLVVSLRTAVESHNPKRIMQDAHALMGLVAGCGGVRAASVAQNLERAGRSRNLADTTRLFDCLTEELERFTQALHDYYSNARRS